MASSESVHQLLPWYVAGTLAEDEAAVFRDHLPDCELCRSEMAFLERAKAGLEEHGESLLEEHPSAERLVAAVRGELQAEESETVLRHLALCPACATEARWVRGEALAAPEVPAKVASPRVSGAGWGWVVAAAAMIVLAMILPLKGRQASLTGLVRPLFVQSTDRSSDEGNVFELAPGEPAVRLYFQIDLPSSSFPIEVRLLDETSKTIYTRAGIDPDDLVGGIYLFFDCDRRDCVPGDYVARIEASDGTQTGQALEFRIVERDTP